MDSMKCHLEKNTVQETPIITLYSRKLRSELYPALVRDETADLIPLTHSGNSVNLKAVTMVELFIFRNGGNNSQH